MADEPREIAIVGAGIIGLCCARWLQSDGHRVTLLDPGPPGGACSWGNAGVIATDMVLPVATPDTLRDLPRMLVDRRSPLAVRWDELPTLTPWLLRFLANARPGRAAANAVALARLCARAFEDYEPLIGDRPAAGHVRRTGWVTACLTQRSLDGARRALEAKQAHGVPGEALDAPALREWVPQLSERVVGGVRYPEPAMVVDPGAFARCLADDVLDARGRIVALRVEGLVPAGDGVSVRTASGEQRFDHAVLAAGVHSGALAASLGDRFPLDTERGYHAQLPSSDVAPPMPVMSGDHAFVTTPMSGGVRLAGTSELGGVDRPPTHARARMLPDQARELFPGLATEGWTEWMGLRPTLPDSLPVIGRSPSGVAVTHAFGHQHLGLTLAGVTGRLVADELAGREPVLDPSPWRPGRF